MPIWCLYFRTNEHLKANHDSRDDDSREDDSIAQHFFNRFTQPKVRILKCIEY